MFGNLRRLDDDEYDEIYKRTGLDADGRQRRQNLFVESLDGLIRGMVKFAKFIPGFNLLELNEKINLIKSKLGYRI